MHVHVVAAGAAGEGAVEAGVFEFEAAVEAGGGVDLQRFGGVGGQFVEEERFGVGGDLAGAGVAVCLEVVVWVVGL